MTERERGKTMRTTTRSAGLSVTVAGVSYLVGSGYEGKTPELDNIVTEEAKLLSRTFDRDIEIRFNSDRGSGGAWLRNSLGGFDGNCQVGFGADLGNKGLYITTCVASSVLKDINLCNSGNPKSRYSSVRHPSLEIALQWLKENIDTSKILD